MKLLLIGLVFLSTACASTRSRQFDAEWRHFEEVSFARENFCKNLPGKTLKQNQVKLQCFEAYDKWANKWIDDYILRVRVAYADVYESSAPSTSGMDTFYQMNQISKNNELERQIENNRIQQENYNRQKESEESMKSTPLGRVIEKHKIRSLSTGINGVSE